MLKHTNAEIGYLLYDLEHFLTCFTGYDMINKKILVVDDETTLCDTLRFNLELEGYEVDTAYSAEEALAMDLSVYALVLLDVMMGR